MRLWTIQPEEVYEILKKDGIFTCNQELAVYGEDFKTPYAWMTKKMDERKIPHPNNLTLPIWAWHTRNWKHKKPDLREAAYDKRGTKAVLLEVEIPDKEVLLSDYDEWHFVLNNSWIDDSENEEEWEELHEKFDKLPFTEREKLKKESWNKIFDVTPFESEWRTKGRYIQACFWELKLENVKKVQHFVCR